MELDSIKKIVQTEQKAEEIKTQAREKAEKMIQDAIESKSQKQAFAKKRIESQRKDLEEKAKAENADSLRKISEMTQRECEQIKQKANEKMETAVNAIFKEVIS